MHDTLAYMRKQVIFAGIFVVLVLASVGGYIVWKVWFANSNTVVLRGDLPPAPKGYDTINKDEKISAEIPQDRAEAYMKEFEEALNRLELVEKKLGIRSSK